MITKADQIVLCVWGVCALIGFLPWLLEEHRKETNRHAEAEMAIMASQDIGQTAWAHSDVHKTELLRQQAKELAELRAWKNRLEKRWGETTIEMYSRETKKNVQV